jgi:hypothetical protein
MAGTRRADAQRTCHGAQAVSKQSPQRKLGHQAPTGVAQVRT